MTHLLAEDLDHVLDHTRELWEQLRGRRLFLTGGTGFVGKWLLESFVWANARIGLGASAVLLTRNPERFRAASPHLASDPALHSLVGDACMLPSVPGEFPFVIHAATGQQFPPDPERPLGIFGWDIAATRHVLDFARVHGAERFLFTSSGAVYGKQPPELSHIPEEYPGAPAMNDCESVYGQAKRVSEFYGSMYARQYGFAVVIGRLFAFSGPHLPLDLNFAVGNFVRDVLRGGPVRIAGDGTPYRSYLYAADLAIWLWTLLFKGHSSRPYNVGSGEALSIAELARVVVQATQPGTPIEIGTRPLPGAFPARYVPAVDRAERELGLKPLIAIDDGIRRMYRWHQIAQR